MKTAYKWLYTDSSVGNMVLVACTLWKNFGKLGYNLCRMLISFWKKEWDLAFHIESCCFFLPLRKIYRGKFVYCLCQRSHHGFCPDRTNYKFNKFLSWFSSVLTMQIVGAHFIIASRLNHFSWLCCWI